MQNVIRKPNLQAVKSVIRPRYLNKIMRARSSVVEHLTFNQRVVGSIPPGLTCFS